MSCYAYDLTSSNAVVGIHTCCNPGDYCLSNTTCYTAVLRKGGGILTGSGISNDIRSYNYYTAGCTDPSYKDPLCSKQCHTCIGLFAPCSGTEWSCGCAVDSCACGASSGCGNFTMPEPSALSTLAFISGSVAVPWTAATGTLTASNPATITVTITTAPNPTSSKQAVKIGVGVGVPLGIIAFVASLTAFWLSRRRKRDNAERTTAQALSDREIASKSELPAQSESRLGPAELDEIGRKGRAELPS